MNITHEEQSQINHRQLRRQFGATTKADAVARWQASANRREFQARQVAELETLIKGARTLQSELENCDDAQTQRAFDFCGKQIMQLEHQLKMAREAHSSASQNANALRAAFAFEASDACRIYGTIFKIEVPAPKRAKAKRRP